MDVKHLNDPNVQIDGELIFYREVMDSCHCYLYHLYDVGLRVKESGIVKDDDNKPHNATADFDLRFAEMRRMVKKATSELLKLENFDFNRAQSNKFNLIADIVNGDDDSENTFMDGLYKYLKEKNIPDTNILEIKLRFQQEHYDSDSVEYDVFKTNSGADSNIRQWLRNSAHFALFQQYIYQIKISVRSFKIGYRFYYWGYYKNLDDTYQPTQSHQNVIDYSLHSPKQLYVTTKHDNLKTEILH
eukprot:138976_1